MNRKKIASLPHMEVDQTGKYIEVYLYEGILIADCYEAKNYIGRYCMQKDGRHDFYSARTGQWHRYKLNSVFKSKWYCDAGIECSKESEFAIKLFFDGKYYKPDIYSIRCREGEYSTKKQREAMKRKKERIDMLMAEVPTLPDDFYKWLNETVFKGKEYAYKVSGSAWYCTACNKTHTSKKGLKHGEIFTCSRTGREVTVNNRSDKNTVREPVVVFRSMDETRSTARHFVAEKTWSKEGSETKAYENVRYILGKATITQPYHTVKWYYGQKREADEFEQDWWDTNQGNKRCQKEYCYPEGVKEALHRTAYEALRLENFAKLGWKLQYNKMMINHRICGFMEYTAKAGLKKITESASDHLSTWGGYYDGSILNIHGETAAEVLGVDMQRYHRLKQKDGGFRYLEWLRWEQEHKKIPEETMDWLDKNKLNPYDLKFILDRMSPTKIKNYLERECKESGKTPGSMLGYWKDYLSMAKRAELDTNDEIVYRAKHLLQRHDELVEFFEQQNTDEWCETIRKKFPDVEGILNSIKDTYEYENEEYFLSVPKGVNDIVRDGRQLHHCAASSERYFEKIENRETYIMFLRKRSRPLHSWYTLEVEPGGTVRQKRSEYNRQPELEKVMGFIKEWQQELKKRLKTQDIELARRSRTMRIMEMKELREKNGKFAEVLDKDLMEVG